MRQASSRSYGQKIGCGVWSAHNMATYFKTFVLCLESRFTCAILRWVGHKRSIIFIGHKYLSSVWQSLQLRMDTKKDFVLKSYTLFLVSRTSTIGRVYVIIEKRYRIFILTSYTLCNSIPILKLEMTIVIIHNWQIWWDNFRGDFMSTNVHGV